MSDFMKWLYAHYIRPQLEVAPPEEYELHLDLIKNGIEPHMKRDYEKAAEFIAIRAFQLGFRTGRGLAE